MTEALSVSSEVEVAADPATAFRAFTDEMDLWWLRGPINFSADAARVVEVRCEPGVGGRIVDIYDPTSGDGFERARITAWEPGVRVAWSSSLDDVDTEVTFSACAAGTRVTVVHRVPAGGVDRGGTSWSRVVPNWFGAWCAKRDRVPHQQIDIARLSLVVAYERPAAAARFLADAFGFESPDDLPTGPDPLPETDYGHPWIEFRIGNALLVVAKLDGPRAGAPPVYVPWVYVDDVEAHCAHAQARGATIVEPLHPYPGSLVYVAEDPEGNRWRFSQARPTMR